MKDRYFINKLGLLNFWYYDIEEFDLSEGKLLLKGSNGSGKSVTMQSFVPLLLDGNKAPDRLDPFGTRARTIGNYLLDEEDTEKTAYLYMEFKRGDNENYITIGIGLKGVKNKPVQSWYFILSDGRRINKDLFLYEDAGELIPLTKKQLQNKLGDGNFFTENQKSYMEMVNKYLFGFDDIESYEELLNLLISIRSPKLSKEFKPTEIYKILTESLKVLSDDDLRPISDSMENMDILKDSLDENQRALKAARNIKYYFDKYNIQILSEKVRAVINTNKEINELNEEKEQKIEMLDHLQKQFKKNTNDLERMETELKCAEEKYEILISKEEYMNKKELDDICLRVENDKKLMFKKEYILNEKKKRQLVLENDLKNEIDKKENILKEKNTILKELKILANEIGVDYIKDCFNKDSESFTIANIQYEESLIKKYETSLKEAEKIFEKFEHKNNEIKEIVKKLDIENLKFNDEKRKIERYEEEFLTEKENFKVNINKTLNINSSFILEDSEKKEIYKAVDKINECNDISDCENTIKYYLNNKIDIIRSNIKYENTVIEYYRNEKIKIAKEVKLISTKKEIEPIRSEAVIKNRERLIKKGVNFIPLYKALDFNKNLSDIAKSNIESSLINMGLIDALVIDNKDKEIALMFDDEMEDKYIFSDANLMSFNLSSLLVIDKEIKNTDLHNSVDEVLQSIFLDDGKSTYLNENGFFKIGILGGKSTHTHELRYIGEKSRKRYKEYVINNKKEEITRLNILIEKSMMNIKILENDICILEKEYRCLPTLNNILKALKMINMSEENLKIIDDKIISFKDNIFIENEKLDTLKKSIMKATRDFNNIKSFERLKEVINIISEYKNYLMNVKILLTKLNSSIEIYLARKDSLDTILEDVDNLHYELNLLNRKIKDEEIKKEAIINVLSKMHLQDIEKEINNVIKIKKEYPIKIKELNSKVGRNDNEIEVIKSEINNICLKIKEITCKLEEDKNIFLEEYNLEYVNQREEIDTLKICKKLHKDIVLSEAENRELHSNKLTESINKNSGELREYNIKEIKLFSYNNELNKNLIRERRDFRCKIQGKEVNFIVLIDQIKKSIEELELLISEEERKIFEEVLMNTISHKIKSKIYQSKIWVKKINTLMSSMDTSSSLKLNLAWIPKKSEGEGQLDITNLIEILERGDRNTDNDFKNLAIHFSNCVRTELRRHEEVGDFVNYHSVIKEVLDYRKWYEFKLYFVKNNDRKKELTNNAFFQFSGGEKAMSMYIPLFSAIYARYEKGRGNCPRIISMDEAFAGVDENNIRDMFRLLKQLDLDYILNSQILWGDYDTVDKLSICELIREDNDDVITVLRYYWNGKEKVLLK